MRRADQVGGLVFLALGVGYTAVALQFPYWAPTGPGSGFLPFWLGAAMTVLAAMLLVGATRARQPGPRWLPRGQGRRRLLAVLGLTLLFVASMKIVGMILGTALFLTAALRLIERYSWAAALAIAAGTATVNYLVFAYWLRVPFPAGVLGF